MKLLENFEPDEAVLGKKKKTLIERLVKCYMHESQYEEARNIVDELADKDMRDCVKNNLDKLAPWRSTPVTSHRSTVLDRVPRFQAHLYVCLSAILLLPLILH